MTDNKKIDTIYKVYLTFNFNADMVILRKEWEFLDKTSANKHDKKLNRAINTLGLDGTLMVFQDQAKVGAPVRRNINLATEE